VLFSLEKLYADRDRKETFTIRYVSLEANQLGVALSVLGSGLLVVALGYFRASLQPAATVSLLIALAYCLLVAVRAFRRWRAKRALAIGAA
jgi:hypothetical protein